MPPQLMQLKILLPFRVFAKVSGAARIVTETGAGSFGLWPHRLDCVAPLMPGILMYQTQSDGEVYAAIDEGVLVKTGLDVMISVRNAIVGIDLDHLRATVKQEFLTLDQQQRSVRWTMAKLETNIVRRLAEVHHE